MLSVAPITSASAKQIPPKAYSTCAALRKVYPNGVAYSIGMHDDSNKSSSDCQRCTTSTTKSLGGISEDDRIDV